MSALRKQMEADLVIRGMAERTREAYLGAVAGLAKYYGRRLIGSARKRCSAISCTCSRSASSP